MAEKMSYVLAKGGERFDWRVFLERLIRQETDESISYDEAQIEEAGLLSGNWVTCACGNQCDVIPRYMDGCPKDLELKELGEDFNVQVRARNWRAALETLEEIEVLSGQLIAEIAEAAHV